MRPQPMRGRRNLETARLERVREENRRRAQALELRGRVGGQATGVPDLAPAWSGHTGPLVAMARAAVCRDDTGRGWCVAFEIPAAGGAQRQELPGSFATLAAAMAAAYTAAAAQGLALGGMGWG